MYFTRLVLIPRFNKLNANKYVIRRLKAPYCVDPSLRVMKGVEIRVRAMMIPCPTKLEIVFWTSRLPAL
jgi:hypothetical protein